MGAKQEKTIRVPHPFAVVVAAAEQALQMIDAQIGQRAPEQGALSARTGMTIWSLGETLQIAVAAESPTQSVVHVSSEAGQLIDWGKNSRNLGAFEQALLSALTSPPPAPRVEVAHATPPRNVNVAPPSSAHSAGRMHRVFVSYRREDSGTIVGRICDRLSRDFGPENVFKDVDNIPFGVDFVEHLDHEVEKCTALFAIIGPKWLAAADQNGRRLDDPGDFVRIEIAAALRRKITVVPILVDGARVPSADELPDELKALSRRNGTEVRHDPDFHNDMSRLLSRLG